MICWQLHIYPFAARIDARADCRRAKAGVDGSVPGASAKYVIPVKANIGQ